MYVIVIALVLMSSVSAMKIPMKVPVLFNQMKQEKPEPCCAPSSLIQDVSGTVTSVKDGELFEETYATTVAYDSIEEQMAYHIHLGFTNGTEESIDSLEFFKTRESYTIFKYAEGDTCYKDKLTGTFPIACVGDQAQYYGSATLGDRALKVNIWSIPLGSSNISRSYTEDECVPITAQLKKGNPETGKLEEITDLLGTNFKLGICDEDEIFRVPDICRKPTLSKSQPKIPEGLMKFRGLIHRAGLFFGGK